MSRAGVNLAVTQDGAAYNKLCRPDDFMANLASQPAPKPDAAPNSDSNKRKLEDAEWTGSTCNDGRGSKRVKEECSPKYSSKVPGTDSRRVKRPVGDCGMQTMFPGLDHDDSADEISSEALAYLRSVRSEASSIPNLLVAAPSNSGNEAVQDDHQYIRDEHKAIYRDGTWVAVDNVEKYSEDEWSEYSRELEPQEQYYHALLRRYEALRRTLANLDARELAASVEANPSHYAKMQVPSSRKEWLRTIDRYFPTPACVSRISDRDVFWGLLYCAQALGSHEAISKQTSCWIWTLLALAGEQGTLDYSRIGRIRDLGCKAGQLGVLLRNGERPGLINNPEQEDTEDEIAHVEDEESVTCDANPSLEHVDTEQAASNDGDEGDQAGQGEAVNQLENTQSLAPTTSVDTDTGLGAQADGADEEEVTHLHDQSSDDTGNMSISEDEGEVRDNGNDDTQGESSALEEARARLLAQLGDRLVQPSVPAKKGPRHFHHGQVCDDPNCHIEYMKAQQERRKASSKTDAGSTQPLRIAYPSRVEAELQRQRMRDAELAKISAKPSKANNNTATPSGSSCDGLSPIKSQSRTAPKAELASDGMENGSDEISKTNHKAESSVDLNTRVTIDMILTVAAERYGQTDLLRYREVW